VVTPAPHRHSGRLSVAREACAFCLQRRNVRRTLRIALVVGVVLTAINQSGVIAAGHATAATWVRCGLNFAVPFLSRTRGCRVGAVERGLAEDSMCGDMPDSGQNRLVVLSAANRPDAAAGATPRSAR
jgi:hypothetical protein